MRLRALLIELHITGNFDCLKVATLLMEEAMATTRDVGEIETLEWNLSAIREGESVFTALRDQCLSIQSYDYGSTNVDLATVTSTVMDSILDELINTMDNPAMLVDPDVGK